MEFTVLQKLKLSFITFNMFATLILSWSTSYCQVQYLKLPKANQVFQRNDQDEAIVQIKGSVTEAGHNSVTLTVLQNENQFFQEKLNLNNAKDFSFSPNLKAGNFNYTFILKLDESNELKNISNVAVGDVFLVYGQSNALGSGGIETYRPAQNQLMRFFSVANYDNGDSEWLIPYQSSTWSGTGAMELQNFLSSKYNLPIGIIQASVGGSDIKGLNYRTENNPTDKNTNYGKMLLQTLYGDLKDQIKYVIFRQGETDGSYPVESKNYGAEFDKLYKNLVLDFPSLRKIFNVQNNILTLYNENAGILREFQRKTKYIYPKITTMSSVGTVGYDGLHYSLEGYTQTAFELSRIIGKEVYNDNQSNQIYSPDLKKIYWENTKLVLEFDEGMEMVYPEDVASYNRLWSMKDFIFVDGKNNVVQSGYGAGNKIYLTLANIENPKFVTYLPNWFSDNDNAFYKGVHFQNKLGMRAFSFNNVEIGGEAPIVTSTPKEIKLELEVNVDVQIKLKWNSDGNSNYHIERSEDNSNFTEIGSVKNDNFIDTHVNLGKTYFYRVSDENITKSQSNVEEIVLKCLDDINLTSVPAVNYVGANNTIFTIVTINNTKTLTLEANKSIDLNHGFDAELGSDFMAEIGGCKNN